MLPRMIWHFLVSRLRRVRLDVDAVARSRFRVWPSDLDVYRHMNNGKYLSVMDVGRYDLMHTTGLVRVFARERWYPVVASQTITYRRSLLPLQLFHVESRIAGFDEHSIYVEQRFVRPDDSGCDEIYALAYVRAKVLRFGGGVVSTAEVVSKTGTDHLGGPLPDWIHVWGAGVRLPSRRTPAPNVWDERC